MITRILTEDINSERVRELCNKRFDSYTMYRGMRVWKGAPEPCLIIEIALLDSNKGQEWIEFLSAKELARQIKTENNQEAVLIEYIDSTNQLI